ncbi:MAG: OB-fold putative lipoprotein [Bacteroidetes bacterium]|jgi:hypothetical protein|nr:OB-fold putative lipoprotein [Bacteroidota bacterium]
MKKFKLWLLILLAAGLLGGTYVWFFVYNKPHRNIETASPDYILTAESLYTHYSNKSTPEGENYDGAVLQISGIPTSIETVDSLRIVVFAFTEGVFGDEGIRCTLLPSHHQYLKSIVPGRPVTLKGLCSGYNGTDVILEQCSIINE